MAFASWDDYWAVRHDESLWTPWFRWALELAALDAADVAILHPSQYPTARCGEVIVTIYPDAAFVFDLEREAHSLLAGQGLPIPTVISAGSFPTDSVGPTWQWLIESVAEGAAWNKVRSEMAPRQAQRAAAATGAVLKGIHQTPHDAARLLNLDWARFDRLIKDEVDQLGRNDGRLQRFPNRFVPTLHELASSTYAAINMDIPPALVHGDVHGDNVFVKPDTGELTALIDLNEMYVGHPWYDLADACFRLLRGRPGLTGHLIRGYGEDLSDLASVADNLLGWGLLHDFDGLTATLDERGVPAEIVTVPQLAGHLTGLAPISWTN